MTHTRMKTAPLAVVLAILVGAFAALAAPGCATMRKGAAAVLLPVDQEIELGKKISAEMEKELTLHSDPAVQRYVQNLGARVVAAAGSDRHRDMDFTFKVVDDAETINAFALPGGWIYVYSGLLIAAETEAEVVAVLGHEVAHVTRRHIAERLATAYGIQVLTAVALGEDPSTLRQIVGTILGAGYLLKFSRDQETDADITGVRYVVRAGWNPSGFIAFFKRIGGDRDAGSRRAMNWISSHPMPEDRIARVEAAIAEYRQVPSRDGRAEHQRFLAASLGGSSAPAQTGTAHQTGTTGTTGTTGSGSTAPSDDDARTRQPSRQTDESAPRRGVSGGR
jgi:beta-barrel assembly-enhancing protease